MKQYRDGPSWGNSITQNQNTFFIADELSKPNKKYSIATIVIAAPRTPASRGSFNIGDKGVRNPALESHHHQKEDLRLTNEED